MPRPVHFEIHAEDPERAQRFYEAMFGWRISLWGESGYRIVETGADGAGINGGLMQRRGPGPAGDEPVAAWICTVDVEDVDAFAARAEAHGGAIAVPRMAIPGVGWLLYAKDTEGNIFGMMQQDAAAA
jgi:uncharacterized protein